MASYYDGLKYVYKQLWRVNAMAQLVVLHLYQLNNQVGNSGWVEVSDRELMSLTNIRSNETITRVKKELAQAGLIAYESVHRQAASRYEILFYTRGPLHESVHESVQVSVHLEKSLLTRARKTKETPAPPPTQDLDNLTIGGTCVDELEEAIDGWREDEKMPTLYFEQERQIRARVKSGEGTAEQLKRAIKKAKESNSPDSYGHRGLNFTYVWKHWDRIIAADKKRRKVYVASSVERRGDKYPPKKEVRASAAWRPALTNPVDVGKPALMNPVDVGKPALANPVDVENSALANPVDENSALMNPVDENSALANPVDVGKPALMNPVDENSALMNSVDVGKPALTNPVDVGKPALANPVDVGKPALTNPVDENSALAEEKPLTSSERERAAQIKEMLKRYSKRAQANSQQLTAKSYPVEVPTKAKVEERPFVDKATMTSYVAEMRANLRSVIASARKAG